MGQADTNPMRYAENFFILGTIAAMWFGYMYYTQRQGTAPISSAVKQQKAKY